jgi:hypothetical protein
MSEKKEFLARYGHDAHVSDAMKSDDDEVKYAVSQNPILPEKHIKSIMGDDDNYSGHLGLSLNPALSKEHVEKLTKHSDGEVAQNALLHKNISPESVHKAITNPATWERTTERLIQHSPHITKEHLKNIVNGKQPFATNKNAQYSREMKDYAQERLMKEHGDD